RSLVAGRWRLIARRVGAGERLATQRVDDREHSLPLPSPLPPCGMRERAQARDADDLEPQRLRQPTRGRDPDAQAGEPAGTQSNGDPVELAPAAARARAPLARA